MTPTTEYAPGVKVHKFELRGLGAAPYAFLGVERKVYQACNDAPVQPGGTCDYCGTAIMFLFHLRAADGHMFHVGSDCILKCDSSRSLIVAVKTETQKRQAEQREVRRVAKFEADHAIVAAALARMDEAAPLLAAQPHPMGFTDRATGAPLTRLDWATWMLANAGMSGRLQVAAAINSTITTESRTA